MESATSYEDILKVLDVLSSKGQVIKSYKRYPVNIPEYIMYLNMGCYLYGHHVNPRITQTTFELYCFLKLGKSIYNKADN